MLLDGLLRTSIFFLLYQEIVVANKSFSSGLNWMTSHSVRLYVRVNPSRVIFGSKFNSDLGWVILFDL